MNHRLDRSRACRWVAGWVVAWCVLVAPAAGQQPPADSTWVADAAVDVERSITDKGLGAVQGIVVRGGMVYAYGDVVQAAPRVGVIREYSEQLKPTGRVVWLRKNGEPLITHPTGLTWHERWGTLLGDTVKSADDPTRSRAVIYWLDWERAWKDGDLDEAVLDLVEDDAAINGCRPEFVNVGGRPLLATADYGDVHPEVRLYDPSALLAARRSSAPGVVVHRVLCGPFNQNLHWDAESGQLTCVQNVIAGRGWRLDVLDLTRAVADGRVDGPKVRVRRLTFPAHDELEGYWPLSGQRGLFAIARRQDNVLAGTFHETEPRSSPPEKKPSSAGAPLIKGNQRVVVVMLDGFGPDYLEQSSMPVLKGLMAKGFAKTVAGVMPSVTNVNNASICCGVWPEEHGITGNSFLDEATGQAEYMENAAYLLRPTLFERAAKRGVKSALLTAKKKTVALLSRSAEVAIAAEAPSAEEARRYGSPPPIYSREINYWLWEAAVDLLENRPDLGCLYVHTTDYPMHTWPPSAPESKEHLARIDALLGRAVAAAPDAAFLITGDHGLNAKTRCWDLAKACKNRGLELKFALSAERDRYVKHHRTFGGTGYVWLRSPQDAEPAAKILRELEGVEAVITREEAARRFHLMPERIGELVVLGDRETVFGETEAEVEHLPPTFRTHGSLHEAVVPLVIYNASGTLPPADSVRANLDLTRTLYRD